MGCVAGVSPKIFKLAAHVIPRPYHLYSQFITVPWNFSIRVVENSYPAIQEREKASRLSLLFRDLSCCFQLCP